MKIIFTGGGTGGHFYPIIAIAQAIKRISKDKKLIEPKMYFFSPTPYNPGLLYDNGIEYKKTYSGKMRRYFSILNFTDMFKIFWGCLNAIIDVFDIYPDVVFGKGGYGSFPTLFAARILKIPVVIHESDSTPGKVNRWAGRFARKIAISYETSAVEFGKAQKEGRVTYTGQPVQKELIASNGTDGKRFWELEDSMPTILVLGGSQGAEKINDAILNALPELLKNFQIIHQTGEKNIEVVIKTSSAILLNTPSLKTRYKPKGYLNLVEERMAAGAADLIISRAGSAIFEIASWKKPSIIVPIDETISHDQTKNAFAYARSGATVVTKEANLTPHVLISEIKRILENPDIKTKMEGAAGAFFKSDADTSIAKEILGIALTHEELD